MKSTLPPIQPHTKAKHYILRYHLDEWFPILGRSYSPLLYIDGFSGPGEYKGGDSGSPVVALEAVARHLYFEAFSNAGRVVEFLFIDDNRDSILNLKRRIAETSWPRAFKIEVQHAKFERVLTRLLDDVVAGRRQLPPTLAFVDPWGSAGFPTDLLGRLASFDRVDVLINLNIQQFVQWILPDRSKYITADRLYGGPRWRPALTLEGAARDKFLVEEYERALEEIGWRGTSFEMINAQNQTVYHLVFGTGSPKGMEAIKRAMRNASQTGEFRYTDRIEPTQPVLTGLAMENEYAEQIGGYLFGKYEGQEVSFDRLIEEEIDWHRWWLPADLRNGLLYLEYSHDPRIGQVRNYDGRTRRSHSYPEGSLITFGRPLERQSRLL